MSLLVDELEISSCCEEIMNFRRYINTTGNCSLPSASIWFPSELEYYSLLSLQKIIDINKFEYSVIFCFDVATDGS
jgi:hypothetical protein